MVKRCLITLWLIAIVASASTGTSYFNKDSVSLYFQQVKEATSKYERLWNKDIYGPILLVHPDTREAVGNMPDMEGHLTGEEGIYRGFLPRGVPVSNTDIQWSGKHWVMLTLPLPPNKYDRLDLMTHELFHSAQPSLWFVIRREDNQHLDLKDGRIYLRLEMEALEKALRAPRLSRAEEHLRNALIFRKYRHQIYRGAELSENSLELLEGLATYTGQMMSGRDKWQWRDYLIRRAEHFHDTPTFVRSFAYETIPIYGFFLFQKENRWNLKVDNETVLTEILTEAFGMDRRFLLESYVRQVAEDYNGGRIMAEETKRALSNDAELDRYRELFFDLPHLEIRLEDMNMSFDPRTLIPLDEDEGIVYPTVEITDNWGVLTVESGGALLRSDWRWAIVSEPLEISDNVVKGEGWSIQLNHGYSIEETPGGIYFIVKDLNNSPEEQ